MADKRSSDRTRGHLPADVEALIDPADTIALESEDTIDSNAVDPETIDSENAGQEAPDPLESAPRQLQYELRCPQLPLAVYREVAVHLRQLEGVETGLLPQTSQKFDYLQSQVGGLWIRYPEAGAERYQQQVEAILKYYGERYRPWETLNR